MELLCNFVALTIKENDQARGTGGLQRLFREELERALMSN